MFWLSISVAQTQNFFAAREDSLARHLPLCGHGLRRAALVVTPSRAWQLPGRRPFFVAM